MRIAIAGHGPSLYQKGKGKEIDSFDKVVRLKACILNDDYGHKVNAVCASTEVMPLFKKIKAEEYWAYPKNGRFSEPVAIHTITKLQKPVMIPLKFCNDWNQKFREMGSKHPNVSTGMAAILIAIFRWSPKEIKLFGFDTLMNPEIEFDRNMEIPRTGVGAYPDHDWQKENELLTILKTQYGVNIHD